MNGEPTVANRREFWNQFSLEQNKDNLKSLLKAARNSAERGENVVGLLDEGLEILEVIQEQS